MPAYLKVFDIEDACVELQPHEIKPGLLRAYQRNPVELKALYDWVHKADRVVVPALKSLADVVSELEPISGPITLYRGFNPNSFQESLGFDPNEEIEVGKTGIYTSSERSFSTSTELDIAKQFGSIVVRCSVYLNTCNHLRITDALAALICEYQGQEKILSQKEVILFPPINVNWEVVHVSEEE